MGKRKFNIGDLVAYHRYSNKYYIGYVIGYYSDIHNYKFFGFTWDTSTGTSLCIRCLKPLVRRMTLADSTWITANNVDCISYRPTRDLSTIKHFSVFRQLAKHRVGTFVKEIRNQLNGGYIKLEEFPTYEQIKHLSYLEASTYITPIRDAESGQILRFTVA